MDNTVLYDLSYGLYVIGTTGENIPTGCIVNTVFQITAEPAVIAVSLNHNNYTTACIQNTREFTVSILTEQTDPAVIGNFGFHSGRDVYKFDNVPFNKVTGGLPVLTQGISGWMHCKVENMVDVGTHIIFIAHVVDAQRASKDTPMTYAYYHNVIKGSAPKNAPTYRKEETISSEEDTAYECDICHYIYHGDFDSLPDDWVCPICGADKSHFHRK